MSDRAILRVQYTPVSRGLRQAVSGFLKYIQHRDQHQELQPKVASLLKYVAYRDQAVGRGDLFDEHGSAGKAERKDLASFIVRSARQTRPQLHRNREGKLVDGRRAAYNFILSPESAEGLDLKRMTRAMLAQLELDAGGIGPWIAAEHRNTKHPHVHIVLAARRHVAPGRYRSVAITRSRLERMKQAMYLELDRQRGRGPVRRQTAQLGRWLDRHQGRDRRWRRLQTGPWGRPTAAPVGRAASRLRGLARRYHLEAEREALRRAHQMEQEHGR